MSEDLHPPVPKYRLEVIISGNTIAEVEEELYGYSHGGFLIDTDYEKRDEFRSYGGRRSATLTHLNPEMTPERYAQELHKWAVANRFV